MDQSIEWNEAENFIYADRNPYVGPQAVLEGVLMRSVRLGRFHDHAGGVARCGDRVVVLGTYRGTHKSTGKQVRAQFAHIVSVREGRIVRFQQYTDTKQFAETVIG